MLLLKILNSKHVNEEKKNVEPETTGSGLCWLKSLPGEI